MSTPPEEVVGTIELAKMPQQREVKKPKEDWTGIIDPTERRKLQNRLNQRAYRTRTRTAPHSEASSHSGKGRPRRKAVYDDSGYETQASVDGVNNIADAMVGEGGRCINTHPRIKAVMKQFAQHAYERYLRGEPVLAHLPILMQYNAISALAVNAELLGMSGLWNIDESISPFNKQGPALGINMSPYSSTWPASLSPTSLQVKIEHHPWLDLFPLPRMRDNFLRAIEYPELCDEDDLCHDLCQYGDPDLKAIMIVWGQPWDPRSWEASVAFLKKWGWLLHECPEIFAATNYWREKRGEKRLSWQEYHSAMVESRPKALDVLTS